MISPSRHRRKPLAVATPTTTDTPSINLKLIIRFNGEFQIKPEAIKIGRYNGGDTRIISIDRRHINFSDLYFRISQLCPHLPTFLLKYHFASSHSNNKDKDVSPLVSILSDEDVISMVEEYDKLELYSKDSARLWLYVCNGSVAKKSPLKPRNGSLHVQRKCSMNCLLNSNDLGVYREGSMRNLHRRENVMPLEYCDSGSFSNGGQRGGGYKNGTRNQHPKVGLDGRVSPATKCYVGLKPKSNISKQGLSRSYCSSNKKARCIGNSIEERSMSVSHTDFSKDKFCFCSPREKGRFAGGNSKSKVCNVACRLAGAVVENMEDQQDLLTGSPYNPYEVPYHSICNQLGVIDQQEVISITGVSGSSSFSDGPSGDCNRDLIDRGGRRKLLVHPEKGMNNLERGIASSVELLDSLSLSPKGVEPASPSLANSDLATSFLKPQSKHLDLLDRNISTGPKAEKLNAVQSNSCALNATKRADTTDDVKCSNMSSGIYDDLATRQLQTIKNSDLEHVKELGSGAYGTVYYGKWNGSDVAIKRIKPSCFAEDAPAIDRLVADFWKEAQILGQLHHPNIVAFYGVITDVPSNELGTVTEYMVNGSLKQVLQRKDRTIDRRKRILLAMDAAFGMRYLHEKNIVHFDLKSPNLLVNMKDPHKPVCKIGDLGLSKIKRRTLVSGGIRGTIPWMAPELLNSDKMVTEKVDVYSFGIIMWELLTGEEPYANLRSEELIAGIIKGTLRPEIPSWCDPGWRSLMESCWSSNPECRPAFSEIAKELREMLAAMNIK